MSSSTAAPGRAPLSQEQRNFHALVDLIFQHMTDALRLFFLRCWGPFAQRHAIDDACRAETLTRPNVSRLTILPHSFSKFQLGTFKSWKVKLFDISFMSTLCTARCDDEPLFTPEEVEGFTLCRDIRNSLAHQPDIYISNRLLDDFLGLGERAMALFPRDQSPELDPVRRVLEEIRMGTYSPLSLDLPADLYRVEDEFLDVDWETPFRNADKSLLYLGEFNRRDVVVKFFPNGDEGLRALRAEVRVLSALRSPHIVQFYGFYGDSAVVLEFVDGGSLFDRVLYDSDESYFSEYELTCLAEDAAFGILQVHNAGFVHRAIKLGNILLTTNRRGKIQAKITDLGQARTRTSTDSSKGAARYAAPEVSGEEGLPAEGVSLSESPEPGAGGHRFSGASDVFSFGMVLWSAAEKQVPFMGADDIQRGKRPSFKRASHFMRTIISECWQQRPGDRPDIRQVHSLLHEYRTLQEHSLDMDEDSSFYAQVVSLSPTTVPPRMSSPRVFLERMSSTRSLLRTLSTEDMVEISGPSEACRALVSVLQDHEGRPMTCAELGLQLWYTQSAKFKDFNVGNMEAFVGSHPDVFHLDTSESPPRVSLAPAAAPMGLHCHTSPRQQHSPRGAGGGASGSRFQQFLAPREKEDQDTLLRRSPSRRAAEEDDQVAVLSQILRRRQRQRTSFVRINKIEPKFSRQIAARKLMPVSVRAVAERNPGVFELSRNKLSLRLAL